jgi:hypothetical protein
MMMIMKQSVEWELSGETEVIGENLPQCHFVHHKSHMTWPDLGSNSGRRCGKPATNRLSYGTAFLQYLLWSRKCSILSPEWLYGHSVLLLLYMTIKACLEKSTHFYFNPGLREFIP